ncbi:M48 metallopeptidase family protein [Methanogenium organophilum]|uniref:M48 family metallopeptidase n=1 Tax=Methanogenium organophilum TaxID=2199 RepID=A0A9X9S4I0_METOG|nr:M48 family metallopeptidase [Methanogenium organophilum]WAI01342.1 M48 family metallopeptidase [Methanogenium organophilum]
MPKVDSYKDRFEEIPRGIRVIDFKYRWRSCSSKNHLNFHWKIILAPMTIVDYIVVHEMAHLIEKNHTPEFWEIIGTVLPDYEQRKEWLRRNGKYLDI